MKVIFITTESLMDHSYTMITELRKSIELDVYFVAKELTPENEDFCKKLRAKFFKRRRFLNPLTLISEINLLREIKKQKADMVWFNTLSFIQALLLKFFIRHPLINTHDVELHPEETDYHGIISQKITFGLFKKCIAVMSHTQAALFKKRFGFEPYVLQLPVINYYEESSENKKPQEAKPAKTRFLFFGSILPYKGIELLIEAAKILNTNNAEYELTIAGRLKYDTDKIGEEIKNQKNVKHLNEFIDYKKVFDIYQNSDVIIIPYIHVSQCGPLLIGYNQNVPCITSDQPGFREYVNDGKSGLIFGNSSEKLAEKMLELINNPARIGEMKKYISEEIKNRYSMASLSPSYVKVFKEHIS